MDKHYRVRLYLIVFLYSSGLAQSEIKKYARNVITCTLASSSSRSSVDINEFNDKSTYSRRLIPAGMQHRIKSSLALSTQVAPLVARSQTQTCTLAPWLVFDEKICMYLYVVQVEEKHVANCTHGDRECAEPDGRPNWMNDGERVAGARCVAVEIKGKVIVQWIIMNGQ